MARTRTDVWAVEVYTQMMRGRPQWLRSRRMTWTQARVHENRYRGLGYKARIVEAEEDQDHENRDLGSRPS